MNLISFLLEKRLNIMIPYHRRNQYRAWLMYCGMIIVVMYCYRMLLFWTGFREHIRVLPTVVPVAVAEAATALGTPEQIISGPYKDVLKSGVQHSYAPIVVPVKGGSMPSETMIQFWQDLLATMLDAKPQSSDIVRLSGRLTRFDEKPNPELDRDRPHRDITVISEELRDALKASHAKMLEAASSLGDQLVEATGRHEWTEGDMAVDNDSGVKIKGRSVRMQPGMERMSSGATPTQGIVMATGRKHFGMALTSLLMLRRTGSKLPVQVFLDYDSEYDEEFCEVMLPKLGAECRVLERFWETTPQMPAVTGYQIKVLSITLSSFSQVLFLDADCFPIHNPDFLMSSEPFVTHGLITWPDFWLNTAAPALYDIIGIPMPSLTERATSESSILIYDKAKHGASLVMAAYYNFYGPDLYYPLLSQGASGQGDKETFLHAALVTNSPYYDVRTPVGALGRTVNGVFLTAALVQADPTEDYRLWRRQTKNMSKAEREKIEMERILSKSPIQAHALFVHQNQIKLDIFNLAKTMVRPYLADKSRGVTRMWDDKKFRKGAGYDVERMLWEEVLKARCSDSDPTPDCINLRKYFNKVIMRQSWSHIMGFMG